LEGGRVVGLNGSIDLFVPELRMQLVLVDTVEVVVGFGEATQVTLLQKPANFAQDLVRKAHQFSSSSIAGLVHLLHRRLVGCRSSLPSVIVTGLIMFDLDYYRALGPVD
jgi:hypothetical protein